MLFGVALCDHRELPTACMECELATLRARVEELERDIVWAATRGVNVGLSDDEIIRNVRNGRLDAARASAGERGE